MRPEGIPLQQQLTCFVNTPVIPRASSIPIPIPPPVPSHPFESLSRHPRLLPSPVALSPPPAPSSVPLPVPNPPIAINPNKLARTPQPIPPASLPAITDKVPPILPIPINNINTINNRIHILEPHEMAATAMAAKNVAPLQYTQQSASPSFDFPRVQHQPASPAANIPSPPYPVHSAGLYGQVFYAISKMDSNNASSPHLLSRTPVNLIGKRDTPQPQQQQPLHLVHDARLFPPESTNHSHSQRQLQPQQDAEPFRLQPVPSHARDILGNPGANKHTDADQPFRFTMPLDHHLNRIDTLTDPQAPSLVHYLSSSPPRPEHEPIQQLPRLQPDHDHRSAQPRQGYPLQLQSPAPHTQVDNAYASPVHSHESAALRKGGNTTVLLPWDPASSPVPLPININMREGSTAHSDAQSGVMLANSQFPPAQLFDLGLDIRHTNSLPLPVHSHALASPHAVLGTNLNGVHRTAQQLAAIPEQRSVVKALVQELSIAAPDSAPTAVLAKESNSLSKKAFETPSTDAPSTDAKPRGRTQRGRKRKGTARVENEKQGDPNENCVQENGMKMSPAPAIAPPTALAQDAAPKSNVTKRVRRKKRRIADVSGSPITPRKRRHTEPAVADAAVQGIHCPYCKEVFDMKRTRDIHVRKMHEKSFPCDKCPSLFKTRSDANRHMRIVHERIRPFSCDNCPATFAEKGKLRRHKSTVHDKLRPFSCTVCNATFGERGNRNQHQSSRHTGMVIKSPNSVV